MRCRLRDGGAREGARRTGSRGRIGHHHYGTAQRPLGRRLLRLPLWSPNPSRHPTRARSSSAPRRRARARRAVATARWQQRGAAARRTKGRARGRDAGEGRGARARGRVARRGAVISAPDGARAERGEARSGCMARRGAVVASSPSQSHPPRRRALPPKDRAHTPPPLPPTRYPPAEALGPHPRHHTTHDTPLRACARARCRKKHQNRDMSQKKGIEAHKGFDFAGTYRRHGLQEARAEPRPRSRRRRCAPHHVPPPLQPTIRAPRSHSEHSWLSDARCAMPDGARCSSEELGASVRAGTGAARHA